MSLSQTRHRRERGSLGTGAGTIQGPRRCQRHPSTPTPTRRICGGPGLPPPCSPLRDRWWVGVEAPSNMALSRKSIVDSVYTIWNTCPSRAHSSSAATCRGDAAAPLGTFQVPGPSGATWAPGLGALWGSEVTGPPQGTICSSSPRPDSPLTACPQGGLPDTSRHLPCEQLTRGQDVGPDLQGQARAGPRRSDCVAGKAAELSRDPDQRPPKVGITTAGSHGNQTEEHQGAL